MSRPKSPEDALASAHRANLQRYKVVPHRLIWLSGVASAGLVLALAFLNLGLEHTTPYALFFAIHLSLPILLGYLSAVVLGIWRDVRFEDAICSLCVALFICIAIFYWGNPKLIDGLVCWSLIAAVLAVFGVRLGLRSNRIRWDRKVRGGVLPVPFEQGPI